jgi:hypothetical protein
VPRDTRIELTGRHVGRAAGKRVDLDERVVEDGPSSAASESLRRENHTMAAILPGGTSL